MLTYPPNYNLKQVTQRNFKLLSLRRRGEKNVIAD